MDDKKVKIAQNKTPVSLLHELLVKTGSTAKYELMYNWTDRTINVSKFTWKITVGDKEVCGTGNTKKAAKQDAAKNMLMQISENIPLLQALQTSTESVDVNFRNHVGNLSMFCSRNKLPQPQYSEDIEDGPAHLRSFYWNCIVGKHRETGTARSTKAAKQLAAQAMYLKLIREVSDPDDTHLSDYKQPEEFMPFKIEKSEKVSRGEDEEAEWNEETDPISPEPFDNQESQDNADEIQEFHHRDRGDRSRVDRRYEESTDHPSTSGYSSYVRSHDSHGSKRIRIEREEVLEKKYKMRLSSFTDWNIPNASQTTSDIDETPQTPLHSHDEALDEEVVERKCKMQLSSFTDWDIPNASQTAPTINETPQTFLHSHDETSRSTPTEEDHCDVKREMEYSDNIRNTRMDEQSLMHQDVGELDHSMRDQEPELPTHVLPNDPEAVENVHGESEIDSIEREIKPEVKFKIKLGGFTPLTSTPAVSTVSTEPTIASENVSNDRDESISATATIITEDRADGVDTVNLQNDDKIGLRLMNINSLVGSGGLKDAKPASSTSASADASNPTEEKSASHHHHHADLVPEGSIKLEPNSSIKTETLDIAEESLRYSQYASAESQVLLGNINECAQVHNDCSNGNFPTASAQLEIKVKNVDLEKFTGQCEESYDNESSLCRTFNNAVPRLKTQSPMELSDDDNMNEDCSSHFTDPETMSEFEEKSEGVGSKKNSKESSDILTLPKRQCLTDVHSDTLRHENVIVKNNSENSTVLINSKTSMKSELMIGNEKEYDANGNHSNREESEDQVHRRFHSLVINSDNSVVSKEPEESVIEVKKPLQRKISDYYYMMSTEHGTDLKPKVCNRVCDLIDALSKCNVVKNPHIVEEGLEILKDIIIVIDLNLERVVYKARDKEYIVVIRINSIPDIVEMTKNSDLNEAKRSAFFKINSFHC